MKQPSVMSRDFSKAPSVNIERSSFKRDSGYKCTFDGGYLIPFFIDEALPGDTFNVNVEMFARLNTPIVAPMDNMRLTMFFFAAPNRLLWKNWKRFQGERDPDPTSSVAYTIPQMELAAAPGEIEHSLADYFGIAIRVPDLEVSALPFRMYNLTWNQWFRDQNLQTSKTVGSAGTQDIDDGPDVTAQYPLLRRGKRHDYFTSGTPEPQKGDAVPIPLDGQAPITGLGKSNQTYAAGPLNVYETDRTAVVAYADSRTISDAHINNQFEIEEDPTNAGFPNVEADLSRVIDGSTINSLRTAFQMQRILERDMRGGTRYTEQVRARFGVISPDARLQRVEYLSGGQGNITIVPVPQTSTTAGTPQGNISSYGTLSAQGGFTKSFTEHCTIMGLCSVSADLTYQQGIPKMFLRQTRFDFYEPALAHLGEQAIENREIYAQGSAAPAVDLETFAYQERFAEYRYFPSKICGEFRSTAAVPLDIWHLSVEYGGLPLLSPTFIVDDPPIDRIIAVAGVHFKLDCFIRNTTSRPMPVYGVPGMADHF